MIRYRSDDSRINNGLDLQGRSGGYVGNGPAGLLSDTILGRRQQAKKSGQSSRGDDDLGLEIVTSDDVADGSKSWGLHSGRWVPIMSEVRCNLYFYSHEQVHKSSAYTTLNDSLNLVVGSIGKVTDSPTSIDQDLIVERVNELGKHGECRSDLVVSCVNMLKVQRTWSHLG